MRVLRGVRQRSGLVSLTDPDAAAFRTLRAAADLERARRGASAVLFAAAASGDGTSTIAANHALMAAAARRSTLLIDANLGRPTLHQRLRVELSPGLVDVVLGDVTLDQAVRHTTTGRVELHVLPAGSPVQGWADLLSAGDVTDVLAQATASYDTIVIDAPPVLTAPDAALLSAVPEVDTVVVVRYDQRRQRVVDAIKQLRRSGGNIIGVAVNTG